MQRNTRDKKERPSPYGVKSPQAGGRAFSPFVTQGGQLPPNYAQMYEMPVDPAYLAAMANMAHPYPAAAAPPAKQALNMLTVSATSVPKKLAGKIAADGRAGALTPLVARGVKAINVATKSIAIANSYMKEDGIALECSPYYLKNENEVTEEKSLISSRSVVFFLKNQEMKKTAPGAPSTVLKVTKTSDPSKVAGSIAAKTRQAEPIAMQGIGPDSVQHMVNSFAMARRYLKVDSALDITFTPKFVTVNQIDKTSSAMYFDVRPYAR